MQRLTDAPALLRRTDRQLHELEVSIDPPSAETEPVPDPEGGIDPERQFMLRWAALG